jgi:hypothetical protein
MMNDAQEVCYFSFIFATVRQAACSAHLLNRLITLAYFPGMKQPESRADPSLQSVAEVYIQDERKVPVYLTEVFDSGYTFLFDVVRLCL